MRLLMRAMLLPAFLLVLPPAALLASAAPTVADVQSPWAKPLR